MRRISLGLLATTSLVAFATVASAADLARPVYKAPPPPPPSFSWTGFYIGVHVGSGWGTKEWDQIATPPAASFNRSDSSHAVNGILGGGQIGFNYQVGWAVWGVEIQASAADVKG